MNISGGRIVLTHIFRCAITGDLVRSRELFDFGLDFRITLSLLRFPQIDGAGHILTNRKVDVMDVLVLPNPNEFIRHLTPGRSSWHVDINSQLLADRFMTSSVFFLL